MRHPICLRCAAALFLVLLVLGVTPGFAQESAETMEIPETTETPGILPLPDYSGNEPDRFFLTGDWGLGRDELAEDGVQLELEFTQVFQEVTSGGLDLDDAYSGSIDLVGRFDLMRMGVLPGALLTFRGESRYGDTVNTQAGQILPLNTDSAFPLTREADENIEFTVTELNLTQFLSEKLGVIVGKLQTLDADPSEFASGRGRYQFMNLSFNVSPVTAVTVPYSTLGAGVVYLPTEEITVTSLFINTSDSSTTTGFEDFGEGVTWSTEVQTQHCLGGKPGGANLGGIYAFDGDYRELRGKLLIDPDTGIGQTRESDSWALYVTFWQYLTVDGEIPDSIAAGDGRPDLQGIGFFTRVGIADKKTNPVEVAASAGFGGRGTFFGRERDSWGVGHFYNKFQEPRVQVLTLLEEHSQGAEVFYDIGFSNAVHLTLDAQWLESSISTVDEAIVLGARLNIRF